MIRYWGYPAEDHNATTKDGYILGLQRIPKGIKGTIPRLEDAETWTNSFEIAFCQARLPLVDRSC